MHCIVCNSFTFRIVCKLCQKIYLVPNPSQRVLENALLVQSFYSYSHIAPLLHTKHTIIGSRVFKLLASYSFAKFDFQEEATIIPIDDHIRYGYSHTAILASFLKSSSVHVLYGAMRAKNHETYSSKSLAYRKANKREFTCRVKKGANVILVDDLITTGQTLLEASNLLKQNHINPLFALTLANANEN